MNLWLKVLDHSCIGLCHVYIHAWDMCTESRAWDMCTESRAWDMCTESRAWDTCTESHAWDMCTESHAWDMCTESHAWECVQSLRGHVVTSLFVMSPHLLINGPVHTLVNTC